MAKRRVNKYPQAFRKMALERMRGCANVSALAKELGVGRTLLYVGSRCGIRGGRVHPDDCR